MTSGWAVRERIDREDSQRRAEVLDAARAAFEDVGFSQSSVAEIARRAGISRAAFYIYFASKQEALEVLTDELRQRYLEAQTFTGIDESDVKAVLFVTMGAVLDAALENHAFTQVLDYEAIRNVQVRRMWKDAKYSAINRAANYIRMAQLRGLVDPVVPAQDLARMGGSLNDQYATLVLDGEVSRLEAVSTMAAIWIALVRVTS